jgi:hypothetical protein
MKILGKLILIEKPVMEKNPNGIELLPEAQAQKEAEFMKTWTKLKVHAVGEEVTRVKTDDLVLITPKQISYLDVVLIDEKVYYVAQESHIIAVH